MKWIPLFVLWCSLGFSQLAPTTDYTLRMFDAETPVGQVATVRVELEKLAGGLLSGWAYGVCATQGLETSAIISGDFINTLEPDFVAENIHSDTEMLLSVVIDFEQINFGTPGTYHIQDLQWTLVESGNFGLEFCPVSNFPHPAQIVEVFDGAILSFDPVKEPATVSELIQQVSEPFLRGDCNGDQTINLADAASLISIFTETFEAPCVEACDINDEGENLNMQDIILLLMYLFQSGEPPAFPFPDCDVVEEDVDCVTSNCS